MLCPQQGPPGGVSAPHGGRAERVMSVAPRCPPPRGEPLAKAPAWFVETQGAYPTTCDGAA